MDRGSLEEDHPEIYSGGPTAEMYAKLDAETARYGGRLPWSGEYPFLEDAARLGFYCFWRQEGGWEKCVAEHPLAKPDLNELYRVGRWDRRSRTWTDGRVDPQSPRS